MQYSAFTSILKVLVGGLDEDSSREIHNLLKTILIQGHVLQGCPGSLSALVSSLKDSEPEHLHSQLLFLDNCICRAAKNPMRYAAQVEALYEGAGESISFLVTTIAEQWPFVIKNGGAAAESVVGAWIARLLGNLKLAGEDPKALKVIRDKLCEATENKKTRSLFKKALKVSRDDGQEEPAQTTATSSKEERNVDLVEIFGSLPTEKETHNELHRWEKEELEVAIEQGHIAALMFCLCSEYEEVRRQAYANISRFMAKLKVCCSDACAMDPANQPPGIQICRMENCIPPRWRAPRNRERAF